MLLVKCSTISEKISAVVVDMIWINKLKTILFFFFFFFFFFFLDAPFSNSKPQ